MTQRFELDEATKERETERVAKNKAKNEARKTATAAEGDHVGADGRVTKTKGIKAGMNGKKKVFKIEKQEQAAAASHEALLAKIFENDY